MTVVDINAILMLSGYGTEYNDMPLGTNPQFFQLLCNFLRGHLETFGPDFIPPAFENPDYVPPNRGIPVLVFGLTSLAVAIMVVIVRLSTKSLRAAGGRIKRRSGLDGLESNKESGVGWEGTSDWEWWRPWRKYGLRFGRIGWDDWAMIIAVLLLAGYTTLNVLAIRYGGMGKHVYDVSLNSVRFLLRTTFVHSALYLTLAFFIKLSVLLFYLNLFPPTFTSMRRAIYGLIAFFFVYTIVGTTVIAMTCKPVRAFWTLEMRANDSCPSKADVWRRYSSVLGVHVAGDFLILVLPIRLVSQLRLPKRQKVILVCIFSAGGLACIASFLRLYYFPRINASLDVTWNVTEIALWGQVEANIAVICASIPALKPLFSSLNQKRKSYRESTSTAGKCFLWGSPLQPSLSGSHSRNGSFNASTLSPSHEKIMHSHSRNASACATSPPPHAVTLPPVRDRTSMKGCSTHNSTMRGRDAYDLSLAEIDNMDIDSEEPTHNIHIQSPSMRTITPPTKAYMSGGRQEPMENLDGQDSVTEASESTKISFALQSSLFSFSREQYLRPPSSRQQRPRAPDITTQFEPSIITTPASKNPSPSDATAQNSSPQTVNVRSASLNTSKAHSSLPSETYLHNGGARRTEGASSELTCSHQPCTENTAMYSYSRDNSWDTTGLDCAYDPRYAPGHKSWDAHVECGGWKPRDGVDMV